MRLKKILIIFMIITIIAVPVSAKPKLPKVVLVGQILEVSQEEKYTRILVDGYIKNCEVYKEQVMVIVSDETKILNPCDKEIEGLTFDKGDTVYVQLSPIMTKSIPPQSQAIKIQVTKSKK